MAFVFGIDLVVFACKENKRKGGDYEEGEIERETRVEPCTERGSQSSGTGLFF